MARSDFLGRVVVVTGAASGIGRAVALRALSGGARVAAVDPAIAEAELTGEWPADSVLALAVDVTAGSAPAEIVESTVARFGGLDCLVNNAGIYPRNTLATVTRESFERIIAVNLAAPLFLVQAAVAAMRAAGRRGAIVNVGSINAHAGHADLLDYSISKAGLMAMTRNLANALAGTGIRVNQVNVGWTLTEGEKRVQRQLGGSADWFERLDPRVVPLGRLLDPREVAEHICFWAGDASAPATGTVYEMEQYSVLGRL
jgi:NAD(P)-dependent dehydrogenase (short-subunit alcohol dehydrogenase family)